MEKNCHPFFGEKIQTLPSDTFPTKLQIVNYVRHVIDSSSQNRQSKIEKTEKYDQIAEKLVSIWREAYVICFDPKYVSSKIQTEVSKLMVNVKKNLKNILENEEKKTAELSKLDTLFDIAKCRCFIKKLRIAKNQFIFQYLPKVK